jgi:hypothetical protein
MKEDSYDDCKWKTEKKKRLSYENNLNKSRENQGLIKKKKVDINKKITINRPSQYKPVPN